MIYCLLVLLILFLVITYLLNKKDLVNPAFIFTLSFVFSSFWASLYGTKWNLNNMYENTFMVILFGVIEFIIVTLFVKSIFNKKYGIQYKEKCFEIKNIDIDLFIKLSCIFFCILIFILNINFILNVTNENLGNLKEAIKNYDGMQKFSDKFIKPPKILGVSLILINAISYWFIYVIANNFVFNKKIDKLSILIVLLCMIISLVNGGRNGSINLILAGIVITYILLKKKNSFNQSIKLSLKMKIAIITIPIIFLVTFPKVAMLLGRNIEQNTIDYLAIYCGAEIKNLDLYLTERDFTLNYKKPSNDCQTFDMLINWLGPKFGFIDKTYKIDLPFRNFNGYELGNVYTTFYPYIYDFGYLGVVFMILLMAVIVQFVYEKSKRAELSNKPNIWILIYGYMFSSILLSFFSNKFYEQNFNKNLMFGIIFWNFANYFFLKIKLIKNKIRLRKNKNV